MDFCVLGVSLVYTVNSKPARNAHWQCPTINYQFTDKPCSKGTVSLLNLYTWKRQISFHTGGEKLERPINSSYGLFTHLLQSKHWEKLVILVVIELILHSRSGKIKWAKANKWKFPLFKTKLWGLGQSMCLECVNAWMPLQVPTNGITDSNQSCNCTGA